MKLRLFGGVAALVLSALLLLRAFSGSSSGGPAATNRALQVSRGAFRSEQVLTGELEAARGESITVPPLPSWQTSIKWIATDGAEVKKGERVVELDNGAFASDLDTKRERVTQTKQELQQKESEWAADLLGKLLDLESKRVDAQKAQVEAAVPREIVSARDFEDRQTKLRRADVELAKARDVLASQRESIRADRSNLLINLEKARRELAQSETAIQALNLHAPRDGIVVVRDIPWEGRKLETGDAVWVGFPLVLIPEPDSLQVAAALADVDDRKIAAGMPATVVLDAYPNLRFSARIASISAIAQESARGALRRAFKVVVAFDRLDPSRMRPGLSARVTVLRESRDGVLLAPRAALNLSGAQPEAALAGGRRVKVTLGPCNPQQCVVLGGLRENDRLESVAPGRSHG
ncbi:MAG TPA: HlyD family efflux transporter periplasmic adaptor subunit [Thermoanaerobaculia bacterium]|nr:HlyD family efflux transporter periplasmic adaptor subunit [Thermoanaerobaculia bacterium]